MLTGLKPKSRLALHPVGTTPHGHRIPWAPVPMGTSPHRYRFAWPLLPMGTALHGYCIPWAPLPTGTASHGHCISSALLPMGTAQLLPLAARGQSGGSAQGTAGPHGCSAPAAAPTREPIAMEPLTPDGVSSPFLTTLESRTFSVTNPYFMGADLSHDPCEEHQWQTPPQLCSTQAVLHSSEPQRYG